MSSIDFIGDIHGYADHLEALLRKMGYRPYKGGYRHPSRKAFFVGDFIDRGPQCMKVIALARNMVDHGDAIAICGNHELNAVCFNTFTEAGYVRPHSIKNINQHAATMQQFGNQQSKYDEMIEWFKTLPLYYETDHFRVVHASWDESSIQSIKAHTTDGVLSDGQYEGLIHQAAPLSKAVDMVCKGKEAALPEGIHFYDKDGHQRTDIRVKWWEDPKDKTLQEMSVVPDLGLGHLMFDDEGLAHYDTNEKPVFFGHYWLQGTPVVLKPNACCLDYSVAKGGVLCAYRFDGEEVLDEGKLVWV